MKKTQKQMIAEYMREHGSITPLDAEKPPICSRRLAARIADLKAMGFAIKSESEGKAGYARYSIVGEPECISW